MQYFFSSEIRESTVHFDTAETAHIRKSLRKSKGDELMVLNGKGNVFRCVITDSSRRELEARIIDRTVETPLTYSLHVAIAPTKNVSRLEWFVEKAVEIGVSEITPLLTARGERQKVNIDRMERIAISAMKQCHSFYLPRINDATRFKDLVSSVDPEDKKFIAHCEHADQPDLSEVATSGGSTLVLIGPEGDFSGEEIEVARENNFREISLGKRRLRTETAGVFVTTLFGIINQ